LLEHYDVARGLRLRICELLSKRPVDLIHAHSPCLTGLAGLQASRKFNLPLVYEMRALWEDAAVDHGDTRPNSLRYAAARMLESWVLRRADALVCICEGLKREILHRGVPAERVTIVPNGVDTAQFAFARPRDRQLADHFGLGPHPVLGFLGSLYAYEGIELLLRGVSLLCARGVAVNCLVIGGGPEENAIKKRIRELELEECVLPIGPVPHVDIGRYYSLIDLLVYPRRRTRLTELVTPLKPLEAMAQGKLVLASDIGGHREMIRDGETGILFTPDSPEALANAVSRLLEHRERWAAIIEKARRYVEAERNWSRSVDAYTAIYDAAIESHAARTVTRQRRAIRIQQS
jgi:PEP-CTERM/exosortase A-associated glycosyltransferase